MADKPICRCYRDVQTGLLYRCYECEQWINKPITAFPPKGSKK